MGDNLYYVNALRILAEDVGKACGGARAKQILLKAAAMLDRYDRREKLYETQWSLVERTMVTVESLREQLALYEEWHDVAEKPKDGELVIGIANGKIGSLTLKDALELVLWDEKEQRWYSDRGGRVEVKKWKKLPA